MHENIINRTNSLVLQLKWIFKKEKSTWEKKGTRAFLKKQYTSVSPVCPSSGGSGHSRGVQGIGVSSGQCLAFMKHSRSAQGTLLCLAQVKGLEFAPFFSSYHLSPSSPFIFKFRVSSE